MREVERERLGSKIEVEGSEVRERSSRDFKKSWIESFPQSKTRRT